MGDDSFEVCPLDFGCVVNATQAAKAVNYKVYGLIGAIRHDRWRPIGLAHSRTPRNRTGNSINIATICSGTHWLVLERWLLCPRRVYPLIPGRCPSRPGAKPPAQNRQ